MRAAKKSRAEKKMRPRTNGFHKGGSSMFDKISDAAEKVAANVSRRHFLDSLGRWAGATALAMAGVLTTTAGAGAGSGNKTCCFYSSLAGGCSGAVCLPLG